MFPGRPNPRVRRAPLSLAVTAAAWTWSAAARAQSPCPASTLTVDRALETSRWTPAIQSMRAALTGSDRPWHCVGAAVHFTRDASGAARLDVALPSGTTLQRHIDEPSELTATLQAALILDALPTLNEAPAEPVAASPAPPATPPAAPALAPPPPPPPQTPSASPRVAPLAPNAPTSFVEATVDTGMRFGASPSYTSYTVRLSLAFRIRAWSLFAWGRVEPWTFRLVDRGPGRYLLDVGVLGLGATWGGAALGGRAEAGITVSTDSYSWRDQALMPGQKETFVQVRFGLLARWRWTWRGLGLVASLDADLAPVTLAESTPGASIPAPPVWSAGLAVGVSYEVAL